MGNFDSESIPTCKLLCSWCDKMHVSPKVELKERCITEECKAKLVIQKALLSQILCLSRMDGSVRSRHTKLSINIYTDIAKLLSVSQPYFIKRLKNECKQEEVYRYFS